MTFPAAQFSVFLPTSIYLSQDYEQSWIKLQNTITDIFLKVNQRELGFYYFGENPTGQQWAKINNVRTVSTRQVYAFGAILAGAALNIPMNITGFSTLTFTRMYGTFTTVTPEDRPLPYADTALVTNQVSLERNGNNIVVTNGATAPNIDNGIVVLEYLKN
jgi:hypothetical protein